MTSSRDISCLLAPQVPQEQVERSAYTENGREREIYADPGMDGKVEQDPRDRLSRRPRDNISAVFRPDQTRMASHGVPRDSIQKRARD